MEFYVNASGNLNARKYDLKMFQANINAADIGGYARHLLCPSRHVARDLVGEQLPDVALHAAGVGGLQALFEPGALGLYQLRRFGGIKRVEFFFEVRNRR